MDLAMHVFGKFPKEWVVSGAVVHIRLLWPSKTLYHNILACLGQLDELGGSWMGSYAQWSVFWLVCPVMLLDLLYLAHQCTFGHCGSLSYFIFAWIDVNWCSLVNGCSHEKEFPKLCQHDFDGVAKIFRCGMYVNVADTSAQRKISFSALVLKASPHNIGVPSWFSLLPSHHS